MGLKELKEFENTVESVMSGLESMAGVTDVEMLEDGSGIQYKPKEKSVEQLRELFSTNPQARDLICKFFELAKKEVPSEISGGC